MSFVDLDVLVVAEALFTQQEVTSKALVSCVGINTLLALLQAAGQHFLLGWHYALLLAQRTDLVHHGDFQVD